MEQLKKKRESSRWKPCTLQKGDMSYNFLHWQWNVTKLLNYIEKEGGKVPVIKVNVNAWVDYYGNTIHIDEEYAKTIDIKTMKPIVAVQVGPKSIMIIDGNHRLHKVHTEGLEEIDVYQIPWGIQMKFVTNSGSYRTLISYWNLEVERLQKAK